MATTSHHRRGPGSRAWAAFAALLLAFAGATASAACGGSNAPASGSPGAAATSPVASPSIVPAAEPVSRWDVPGSASAAQTRVVALRYAWALNHEQIPFAGLYTAGSTWDYWATDSHAKGALAIDRIYRDAAPSLDWSKRVHLLVARGVAVYEGVLTVEGTDSTPSLSLLAVDGNEGVGARVVHEEIFLNEGDGSPVVWGASKPGRRDTAKAAGAVCAAVGEAFATGDRGAMQALLAPGILFRDTAQSRGVRGWDAFAAWWDKTPTVDVQNKTPISGPGWAVGRWVLRQGYSNGVEVAMPGATVMDVRGGKVVRMTLYYNSNVMRLQG
jgi:hypothetical protein